MKNPSFKRRDWGRHPPFIYADYKSTTLRGQTRRLVPIKQTLSELTGPVFGQAALAPLDHDLLKNSVIDGPPLGERIIVAGRVVDEDGRPQRNTVIEIWQANAAGRYVHDGDRHDAPIDPNFLGSGRCITDDSGHYRFYSIKPGAYPWPNHRNAWRPSHIHFSLFGPSFATRLVTQMYFPGDPLLDFDPIFQGAPDGARENLIAAFSLDITEEGFALGYNFDIVLRGRDGAPKED